MEGVINTYTNVQLLILLLINKSDISILIAFRKKENENGFSVSTAKDEQVLFLKIG